MRDRTRYRLVFTSCVVLGLLVPAPGTAQRKKASPPPRGWVVDRVRLENLSPDGFLTAAGIGEFRGALELVPAGGGVALVNDVALEDYVQGVAEVPASWPAEAQRAQAIAARTYALHEMRRKTPTTAKGVGADICAVEACQVYAGLAKERQENGSRWVAAVQSTRGQVLLYRGEPILAMYSSSNGGNSVQGGRPYLRSAPDPDSAKGPYNSWQVRLGYDQLTSAFGLPGPLTSLRRTGDAVALDWAVPDAQTGQTVVPVAQFRARLNEVVPPQGGLPRTVPSTQFSVLADDPAAAAVLDGRGHGHGIGMSQFGALGKASRGLPASAILASYYGGLKPTTLPPEQLPSSIRVALETGTGVVTAGGSGRFRVLDGSGSPVAVAAHGSWRFLPAGRGKVRVVPPADQEAAPAVDGLVAELPPGPSGAGGQARFRLATAAVVRARVEGAGLAVPLETEGLLTEPGDAVAALPALPGPGRYVVSVLADGGAGRVTTVAVPLRISAPKGSLTGRRPAAAAVPNETPRTAGVAWALLVVVTVLSRSAVRRRPRRSGPR